MPPYWQPPVVPYPNHVNGLSTGVVPAGLPPTDDNLIRVLERIAGALEKLVESAAIPLGNPK